MNQNFKVGEKVVALTNSSQNYSQDRIEGTVYTVTAIRFCPECGTQSININHKSNAGNAPLILCNCGLQLPANNRGWTASHHFTRPISNEYKLEVAIPELLEIKTPQLQ